MCNLSYATTQICSCMCHMQLNFSYKRQLQNPKFLVMNSFLLQFVLFFPTNFIWHLCCCCLSSSAIHYYFTNNLTNNIPNMQYFELKTMIKNIKDIPNHNLVKYKSTTFVQFCNQQVWLGPYLL